MKDWEISNPKYESDDLNSFLEVSPWCGHRNFVYDYLKYIKPKNIIELGTHYGCSFFAMCQSMKDNQLNIKLYAVDTWEGDEQAGFYGNEVWESVNKIKQHCFSEQNTVFMRMLFNDAVKEFDDETFDLIHIDGLHTYEAVSEDFQNWLPKLKKDGVILFHDVNSEKKYGTNVFWKEIKQKYSYYFEFKHSWGLGLLFPKGDKLYKELLALNFLEKQLIYQYKALYEYETKKTRDLTQMADDRYEAIQNQSRMIDERDMVIKSQKALIDEKDEGIRNQSRMIDERDAVIKSQKKLIDERDEAIMNQKELIDEKDEGIRNQSRMIEERDTVIKSQKELIDEKDEGIRNQSQIIKEKDIAIEEIEERIAEYSKRNDHLERLMQRVYKHKIISKWILKGEV